MKSARGSEEPSLHHHNLKPKLSSNAHTLKVNSTTTENVQQIFNQQFAKQQFYDEVVVVTNVDKVSIAEANLSYVRVENVNLHRLICCLVEWKRETRHSVRAYSGGPEVDVVDSPWCLQSDGDFLMALDKMAFSKMGIDQVIKVNHAQQSLQPLGMKLLRLKSSDFVAEENCLLGKQSEQTALAKRLAKCLSQDRLDNLDKTVLVSNNHQALIDRLRAEFPQVDLLRPAWTEAEWTMASSKGHMPPQSGVDIFDPLYHSVPCPNLSKVDDDESVADLYEWLGRISCMLPSTVLDQPFLSPARCESISVAACKCLIEEDGSANLVARLLSGLVHNQDFFAITLFQPRAPLPTCTKGMASGRSLSIRPASDLASSHAERWDNPGLPIVT